MVYDRTHTRELAALSRLRLNQAMPFAAVTFVLAGLASMGLPGFSGFVAEVQVLIGAWQRFPALTVLAGLGILVGIAYMTRTIQQSFYSGTSSPAAAASPAPLDPITIPERLGALLLLSATLLIGVYPRLLLDWIVPSLSSPLMLPMLKGVGP
jgi:NADH-quinone oxidoreductase subunit M